MSKFKFIQNLLENEKFNLSQKERFFKLVSKELENSSKMDEQVLEDIKSIKEKIGLIDEEKPITKKITIADLLNVVDENSKIESPSNEEKENLPIYLNPRALHDFLIEYNQDPILKYTCHTIDSVESLQNILDRIKLEEYDFSEHLKIIHINFNKLSKKYKGKVLKNIIGLMSTYLGTYDKNVSWSESIKIKWISEELMLWCKENKGKVPSPLDAFQKEKFRFKTIEFKNGTSISNFSDLVIYYKHLFHIKNGNSLKPLIEDSIYLNFSEDEKYSFIFDQSFSNNIDLHTYIEPLIQVFNKIIIMSKKYHHEDILKVKIYFNYDKDEMKEFKIVILNSPTFGKNFIDFRYGDDLKNLINKQINGLSNFYIKGFFEDKKSIGLVNVWNGKEMEFKEETEEIEGVEFILKMH